MLDGLLTARYLKLYYGYGHSGTITNEQISISYQQIILDKHTLEIVNNLLSEKFKSHHGQ